MKFLVVAERWTNIAITMMCVPFAIVAYFAGLIWGSLKYSFVTGYMGSIAGVTEKEHQERVNAAIDSVMAQANARPKGASVQ